MTKELVFIIISNELLREGQGEAETGVITLACKTLALVSVFVHKHTSVFVTSEEL